MIPADIAREQAFSDAAHGRGEVRMRDREITVLDECVVRPQASVVLECPDQAALADTVVKDHGCILMEVIGESTARSMGW